MFEKDKEIILNYVKEKLNNAEFEVVEYFDNGKTIKIDLYIVEDDQDMYVAVNRRKDGYRIVSMG